jgi:hypothetical protein
MSKGVIKYFLYLENGIKYEKILKKYIGFWN